MSSVKKDAEYRTTSEGLGVLVAFLTFFVLMLCWVTGGVVLASYAGSDLGFGAAPRLVDGWYEPLMVGLAAIVILVSCCTGWITTRRIRRRRRR